MFQLLIFMGTWLRECPIGIFPGARRLSDVGSCELEKLKCCDCDGSQNPPNHLYCSMKWL